jgi:predicted phosphohydrolase
MMIGIVGLTTSCMKGQGIYTKFKVKYSKKETLQSIIIREEETSTLAMDLEEEDEEEVWVEDKDISSVMIVHNHDTWQWTIRTLSLLAAIAAHLNML